MSDHTRTPYFPENLQDYAPWVATHGLLAPYGECQCGCGQPTPIAKKTNTTKGIAKGYPTRYLKSHTSQQRRLVAPPGFRVCYNCQETKPLSDFTLRQSGKLAGQYETQCRACKNALNRQNQKGDPDYQKRNREQMRAWRERNREWYLQYRAQYDANHRDRHCERARAARAKYPEREMAHKAVQYAVQRGDLPPAWAMVCDICQEAQALEYHHHKGYEEENQLNVLAVCLECHGLQHRIDS